MQLKNNINSTSKRAHDTDFKYLQWKSN